MSFMESPLCFAIPPLIRGDADRQGGSKKYQDKNNLNLMTLLYKGKGGLRWNRDEPDLWDVSEVGLLSSSIP